jgi:hypothetical protein
VSTTSRSTPTHTASPTTTLTPSPTTSRTCYDNLFGRVTVLSGDKIVDVPGQDVSKPTVSTLNLIFVSLTMNTTDLGLISSIKYIVDGPIRYVELMNLTIVYVNGNKETVKMNAPEYSFAKPEELKYVVLNVYKKTDAIKQEILVGLSVHGCEKTTTSTSVSTSKSTFTASTSTVNTPSKSTTATISSSTSGSTTSKSSTMTTTSRNCYDLMFGDVSVESMKGIVVLPGEKVSTASVSTLNLVYISLSMDTTKIDLISSIKYVLDGPTSYIDVITLKIIFANGTQQTIRMDRDEYLFNTPEKLTSATILVYKKSDTIDKELLVGISSPSRLTMRQIKGLLA